MFYTMVASRLLANNIQHNITVKNVDYGILTLVRCVRIKLTNQLQTNSTANLSNVHS